ncbi:MAG: hypothetical protein K2J51_08975 [Alistipes sp.]|nr:hypothetical protein [Alistipes sp.]MDE6858368.1 hypothetical protein [Alistipes sp.]
MKRVSTYDWAALVIVAALCAAWFLTGCRLQWLRYTTLAVTFLYLFVFRIAYNHIRNREK